MVALVGSKKQIPWAESIRSRVLGDLKREDYEGQIHAGIEADKPNAQLALAAYRRLKTETDAHWWIMQDGKPSRQVLVDVVKNRLEDQMFGLGVEFEEDED